MDYKEKLKAIIETKGGIVMHVPPEKIYIHSDNDVMGEVLSQRVKGDIEYVRTDAFVEKACEWLECNLSDRTKEDIEFWIEDFIMFMKGE